MASGERINSRFEPEDQVLERMEFLRFLDAAIARFIPQSDSSFADGKPRVVKSGGERIIKLYESDPS